MEKAERQRAGLARGGFEQAAIGGGYGRVRCVGGGNTKTFFAASVKL